MGEWQSINHLNDPMKTLLFISLAVLAATDSLAHAASVTGSWSWTGHAEDSGGFLSTIQTGRKVKFQLELQRGAPSYNSGFIEGEFELKGNKGVFFSAVDNHACEITLIFSPKHVVLSQSSDKDDCGFGYGVYADGKLNLDSRERSKMSAGDTREGTE